MSNKEWEGAIEQAKEALGYDGFANKIWKRGWTLVAVFNRI